MRKIEFRAWLKDEKKMVKVVGIDWDIRRIYYNEDCYLMEALFNEIELMQFTGLCDKNGNKIFEGDICTNNNGKPFVVELQNFYYWVEECVYSKDSLEVVGNIYDNESRSY